MVSSSPTTVQKKPISWSNIFVGAALNLCEVTTLGQPFEVMKTTMAANRSMSLPGAIRHIFSRGGIKGYYQGLIPWGWIEGATKGAVLLPVSSEAEYRLRLLGAMPFLAGIGGGMAGGVAQAYLTMGFCTCMKTAEITRKKDIGPDGKPPKTTLQVFGEIYKNEGIKGINRGVNAVALRQCTNWGSRFGISRLAEQLIRKFTNKKEDDRLAAHEKILASVIGGGLSAWNQPIEVVRVEMQSRSPNPNKPKGLSVLGTLKYVYKEAGMKGLFRGVTPRVCLGIWQTVFMVCFGDYAKEYIADRSQKAKKL
ncbi:Mitochondrial DNA replication protein yhm2 [Brettanomyces nanus]|uniref:Mitochondrial DNA replication protein yhm2 n=1 Tax=Eeniella nana TaxID=13502 RepID=A0A875RZI1_EENNA|nr:Mitochondrial DNA replication protein yhm2 [Brettanomyces nanus]QPG73069.1 Mitochondrial DNA replication protein yhm2 [Brettanomyces nanus]